MSRFVLVFCRGEEAVMTSYGVLSLLGGIPLGALGWLATNFIARPILRAYELRERVWEELLVTANVSIFDAGSYEESVRNLRRYAAQASALDVAWPSALRWLLRSLGLDLRQASTNLVAVSNTLGVVGVQSAQYRRDAGIALGLLADTIGVSGPTHSGEPGRMELRHPRHS